MSNHYHYHYGTSGWDTIVGHTGGRTGHSDVMFGYGGDDTLLGFGGDDILIGGTGKDTLDGGSGIDTASYYDSIGGVYVNLATGKGYFGDAQGDTLQAIENLEGSKYNDWLFGNSVANVLTGLGGNDYLVGAGGGDTLNGGKGHDILNGGAGADELVGGSGNDTASYYGSTSGVIVTLVTGKGYWGDAAGDTLSGIENLSGSSHDDWLVGDSGDNVLKGGSGNDTLVGGAGNDELYGGSGDDTLYDGGTGFDKLVGGSGNDTVSYYGSTSGVGVDLGGVGFLGDADFTTFSGIENVTGSSYDDFLTGDSGNNVLKGGAGHDVLYGNAGYDTLTGGSGGDEFLVEGTLMSTVANGNGSFTVQVGQDTITDYNPAEGDTIVWPII